MAKYNEVELELSSGHKYIVREDSIAYAAEKGNAVCNAIADAVNVELKKAGLTDIKVSTHVKASNPEEELRIIAERINSRKEEVVAEVFNLIKERSKGYQKGISCYLTVWI